MPIRKLTVVVSFIILLAINLTYAEKTETAKQEEQEFRQDFARVDSLRASLSQIEEIDLNAYEAFADSLEHKWRGRNREYYARLMLRICILLTYGHSKGHQQYELARNYALSALEEPDSIPLIVEFDLIGYVTTSTIGPRASKGTELAARRMTDTAIRLHSWKRLLEAIDPHWDPDENITSINISPPAATGLPSGIDPAAIQDSVLRAEYKDSLQLNSQRIKKYNEQYDYHKWLAWYIRHAEKYIIQIYSYPPFAIDELKKMLNPLPDQDAKARILEAVEKNIRDRQKSR